MQVIHDFADLKNGHKHVSISAEFSIPLLCENLAIYLGMQPIKDGCDTTRAEILGNFMSEFTGLCHINVCYSIIVDYAAKGVV